MLMSIKTLKTVSQRGVIAMCHVLLHRALFLVLTEGTKPQSSYMPHKWSLSEMLLWPYLLFHKEIKKSRFIKTFPKQWKVKTMQSSYA